MPKQTFTFHSVVKNEAEHIGLLLASVKKSLGDQLNYWVIVDTGSTDDTKLIIKESLKDIPGELIDMSWDGFGPTRTKAIERAYGHSDYIVIADGDYSILRDGEIPELTEELYLANFEGVITWRLPMILKDDPEIGWFWHGRVHEVLYAKREYTRGNIDELTYIHRATEQQLDESLDRNLKLLLEDWAEVPDPRTAFYLGNTYCDLGDVDKSCYYYQKRIEFGDSSDEVWFSQYQQARQTNSTEGLLNAFYMGSHRVEPLYYLGRIYRQRGMHSIALIYLDYAVKMKYPEGDTLFVDLEIYMFRLPFEWAYNCWVEGRREEAEETFEWLLSQKDLPNEIRVDILKARKKK